jgi:hypothetical protein
MQLISRFEEKEKKMFFGGGSESGVIYNDIDIVI